MSRKASTVPRLGAAYTEEDGFGADYDRMYRWLTAVLCHALLSRGRTSDGGTHLEGLKSIVTRTVNALARKTGKLKETAGNIGGDFVREVSMEQAAYRSDCLAVGMAGCRWLSAWLAVSVDLAACRCLSVWLPVDLAVSWSLGDDHGALPLENE